MLWQLLMVSPAEHEGDLFLHNILAFKKSLAHCGAVGVSFRRPHKFSSFYILEGISERMRDENRTHHWFRWFNWFRGR